MRTILSLVLAFGLAGGITVLSGCEKKAVTKEETKKEVSTPGGGTATEKTETEHTETPPKK